MNTAARPLAVLAAIVGLLGATVGADAAGFTTSGRALLRDGAPFQVRGVDYQPAPIGDNPSQSAPFGDYYTTNYAALHARDLPLLRAMGANVIRIYGWNATANHSAFLDACYNGGVNPIFVLVNRWIDPATNWTNAAAVNAIRDEFLTTEANLQNHPAVLGLVLGNETNAQNGNGANAAFWSALNTVAAAIKQQNPARLVSTAITDAIPQITARDATMTALDFWCVQVYRGTTFGSFFDQYAAASSRPLIVTEFGIDAFNHATGQQYANNAEFTAITIAALWNELAANSATCAGGCVFQFADEWWKTAGGSPSTHDSGGFANAAFPDGYMDEEWWGLYAVADNGVLPDILTPRAAVARLTALWAPPPPITIVTPPEPQTIAPGGTATFSVNATTTTGTLLTYQWLKNGAPISGATNASLVLTPLTPDDSAEYAVRITAGTETTTSDAARLLVAAPEPGNLINLSVRSPAGTGEATLITGFVIDGNVPRRLLIRGVGPALLAYGVGSALDDPLLRVFDSTNQPVAVNDNWSDAPDPAAIAAAAQTVHAFPLASGSRDAALLRTFVPGLYTAHVTSVDGAIGVALVEVYDAAPQ